MNRIVNNPDFVVEDMLKGFVKTHKDIVSTTEDARVLKYKNAPVEGKVGIVTGGGSGHKPAFIGYIGENLCDAVAVGEIFSSPTAKAFLDAIKEADSGKGVACLYGNYAGDNMGYKIFSFHDLKFLCILWFHDCDLIHTVSKLFIQYMYKKEISLFHLCQICKDFCRTKPSMSSQHRMGIFSSNRKGRCSQMSDPMFQNCPTCPMIDRQIN